MTNERLALSIVPASSVTAYNCAVAMGKAKDEQPILEQGGWHNEEPTEDGWYLIKSNDFPKNCECMVAEWDNNAKSFYSEASDEPVSYREWKLIEKR